MQRNDADKSTKEKIFNAAIELFSRKGYDAVSIREITRAVGIKESSLYNHFKSKEELFQAIFDMFKSNIGNMSFPDISVIDEMISALTPEMFLINNLIEFRKRLTEVDIKIWRIIYMEQYRNESARSFIIDEMQKRSLGFYERLFSRMIEKGLIKPYNPRILAYEYNYPLLIMANEFINLQFDNKDTSKTADRMVEHIKFFCEILTP